MNYFVCRSWQSESKTIYFGFILIFFVFFSLSSSFGEAEMGMEKIILNLFAKVEYIYNKELTPLIKLLASLFDISLKKNAQKVYS